MRPGTIGVCADELSRFSAFTVALACVDKPPGTRIRFKCGQNIVKQCNALVADALEAGSDWLWLLGDDGIFATDILLRLLGHVRHGVHCVVPLMLMRQHPFPPVVFDPPNEDGSLPPKHDLPPHSLVEVYAAGTHGMLLTREVLERVGPDPFSYDTLPSGERLGEDLSFCNRLREAGIPIHCDTGVHIGHLAMTAVWPEHTEDGWNVRLNFNSGAS